MSRRYIIPVLLGICTFLALAKLTSAIYLCLWEPATTYATLFIGFVAADVVVWQGYLIKRQLAFSTYLDLDKEWNSSEMIKARQNVHARNSEEWNDSLLEAILEFFEKLASMFKLSGDMPFIYESTLGWYAAQYFLFAREHGRIRHLRDLWKDQLLYSDLEHLYSFYLKREVGHNRIRQNAWEASRLSTENQFWKQERED
jgi:hypothetical protein